MCFRLLIATKPAHSALEQLGAEHGLDVRPSESPGFASVAWGDCACSIYTRADGRRRIVDFVRALIERQHRVQLLLFTDEVPPSLDQPPLPLTVARLAQEGLAAIPEGNSAEIS